MECIADDKGVKNKDLAARAADLGSELGADDAVSAAYDRRDTGRLVKQLDGQRKAEVEQLKHAVYFPGLGL